MRVRVYVIAGVAGALALLGSTAIAPLPWLRAYLAGGLQPLAASVAPGGRTAADDVVATLQEQIAKLSGDNIELRARLEGYAQIEGEGKVLAERVVVARGRVIGRTRRSGRRYVELDIGRVDGVAKGMPVAMGWSLVGEVVGTDDGRCLVQELTDVESRVAAMVLAVQGNEGAAKSPPIRLCEGVAAGLGRRRELQLNFIAAAPDVQLRPGMAVVTSGAEGRFPAGMVLGSIREASHAGTEAWQVSIMQARDPELAESLLVLRSER